MFGRSNQQQTKLSFVKTTCFDGANKEREKVRNRTREKKKQ